jgi:hypothetical protein
MNINIKEGFLQVVNKLLIKLCKSVTLDQQRKFPYEKDESTSM